MRVLKIDYGTVQIRFVDKFGVSTVFNFYSRFIEIHEIHAL